MSQFSRRAFLRAASATVATPFALNLAALGQAAAANAVNDYKALVCIFLAGGNDPFNTVLATDPDSWEQYSKLRTTNNGSLSIALPRAESSGGVLPIHPVNSQGRSFALHPQLGVMQNMFDNGRMAIVANVGTLLAPITRTQYRAGLYVPSKLFSHNDQQSMWQAYAPEGARTGWGGRIGDLLAANNTDPTFTCVSVAGSAVFLSGQSIIPYQIAPSGTLAIRNLNGNLFGARGANNTLRAIISGNRNDVFEKDHANIVNRSINAQSTLAAAMAPAGAAGVPDPTLYQNPVTGVWASNPLAQQLQAVARIIAGRNSLGARRQVFYVSLPGFDTHDAQRAQHADLMAKLAHAVAYFDGLMGNLMGSDLRNQVTSFTASEFGRTFTSNGDGSDHGWGNHHFVFGGAVRGKDIYGSFPVTGIGHDLDVGSGALLPTLAVEQYAATLAAWFGLSGSQIATVFPNLSRFSGANLGFMQA
ncbi:DUF1501 domain-containing protein [Massilia sp. W12]|uniref:DUF1501 domain-containing protein n=1 Tax=Massilia sp. W12 TaxID=3126507 RepID=UPI0030D3C35D